MNHFRLPFINPFKFVRYKSNGVHFDDKWACEQIKVYQRDVRYHQKWVRSDVTKLQCESSIYPDPILVYNTNQQVIETFSWNPASVGLGSTIYETTFDMHLHPAGIYFLFQGVTLFDVDFSAISEPINIKDAWPGTYAFKYKNSFNDFDIAWTTGIEMLFRCEAVIDEMNPEIERISYISQTNDISTLNSVPWRKFKLFIGGTGYDKGVTPYILDILNRVLGCDYISIEGKQFQRSEGASLERQPIKGYPLVTASIDIQEAFNNQSLEFEDATPLGTGIVTAYNIETSFFGPAVQIPVIDLQEQS